MYSSEQAARAAFSGIKNKCRNLAKELSHLASGTLSYKDGDVTDPNDAGHFTLFELTTSNIKAHFAIVGAL
jgi:hypothetical protein